MAQPLTIRFRDHPPGLLYLFFAEMWERFSYYGMRGMLVFFMTMEVKWSQEEAYGIYGTYTALVYTTPIIGGWLADRILGEQKAIIAGGLLIAIGHLTLAMPGHELFFLGLAFIVAGTGLFKANISSLVGKLYPHGDHRRDTGFTIFYVGVNLGSFIASLACGYVGKVYGWHYGFSLAAFGMLMGLLVFMRGLHSLEGHGLPRQDSICHKPVLWNFTWEQVIYALCVASVPLVAVMIANHLHFGQLLEVVGVGVLAYLGYLIYSLQGGERQSMIVMTVLLFFWLAFIALYEQIGSAINYFAELQVDRHWPGIWGDQIPAIFFQSLNPLFVILMGPVLALIWSFLAARNRDPYAPFKFFIAAFLSAVAFVLLAWSTHFVDAHSLVSPWWLVVFYLIITIAELCISPVGLSTASKLSPPNLTATVMGIWFIAAAYGNYLAGELSKLSAVDLSQAGPDTSLESYKLAFTSEAYMALGIALLMLILVPFLKGPFVREEKMRGYNE